jgi:uncharacterized Ntn-hydrolase superfamily protein
LGRTQRSVSMGQAVWDFVYDNFHRLGYKSHSLMIEACVIDAIKNKFHTEVSQEQLEHLKAYQKVGRQAETVKPFVFVGNASDAYLETEKKYKRNVRLGLMTEEQMHDRLNQLRKVLKVSVQTSIKDQERMEANERAKRKKALLKKHGYKVAKNGKTKRKN